MSFEPRLNVLVAYPYLTPQIRGFLGENTDIVRFIMDSGAFTAWRGGTPIELDDYCRFIETIEPKPWRYFALDVIGDPAGTRANFLEMVRRGFKPIPIFTRGEDPAVLEEFYAHSDMAALGALVGTSGSRGFVNGIMKHVGPRKVHWFGFANGQYLRHYRPFSCDTSSFEGGARYGNISLYMGRGQFATLSRKSFTSTPSPAIRRRIDELGFTPSRFAKAEAYSGGYSLMRKLCAASAVAYMVDVERNLGTKVFCAYAASDFGRLLANAFRYLFQGGPRCEVA